MPPLPQKKPFPALYVNQGSANPLVWKMNDGTSAYGLAAILTINGKQASYEVLKSPLSAIFAWLFVVSIGPGWMNVFPYGPALFEGHELAQLWSDDPHKAFQMLAYILQHRDYAQHLSEIGRAKAIELFGRETIASQWASYLGIKVPVAA